jgi:hypothetical protein
MSRELIFEPPYDPLEKKAFDELVALLGGELVNHAEVAAKIYQLGFSHGYKAGGVDD